MERKVYSQYWVVLILDTHYWELVWNNKKMFRVISTVAMKGRKTRQKLLVTSMVWFRTIIRIELVMYIHFQSLSILGFSRYRRGWEVLDWYGSKTKTDRPFPIIPFLNTALRPTHHIHTLRKPSVLRLGNKINRLWHITQNIIKGACCQYGHS